MIIKECGNCKYWKMDITIGYYGDCENEIVKAMMFNRDIKPNHHFSCFKFQEGKDDDNN